MIDRIPEQVFDKTANPPLAEYLISFRPDRRETLNTYNQTFLEFMRVRDGLQIRYDNGEFGGLGNIVTKINAGQTPTTFEANLMRDFRTLVDGEIVRFSHRNLLIANHVRDLQDQLANGYPLLPVQNDAITAYHEGQFNSITIADRELLPYEIRLQRYIYPAGEGDSRVILTSGVRTEPLIRFLSSQINREERSALPTFTRLQDLRRRRDVLFSQSTPYLDGEKDIRHDQIQADAFFNDQNQMFKDTIIRNWLNGENLAQSGLVLNIPREMRRDSRWWLFLPFLIPIPLLVQLNNAPCSGTGGELAFGVFSADPRGNFEEGANAQTIGYFLAGIPQNEARMDTDPEMRTALARISVEKPGYYEQAQGLMHEDHVKVAQRMRGDDIDSPWVDHQGFKGEKLLPNCLSPQQVDERVNTILERRNNPQWWDGIAEKAEAALRWLPKFSVHLR